jgi:tRNA(Ile)-lysidine synthase TilS/MesJ
MRRGHLYAEAKKRGCNKIALGHHMSDVIETTLMGMMYGAQLQGMLPRLKSTNFEGLELIRPLYCILEEDILRWCEYNDLHFIRCACRFTEKASCDSDASKRLETKFLIKIHGGNVGLRYIQSDQSSGMGRFVTTAGCSHQHFTDSLSAVRFGYI